MKINHNISALIANNMLANSENAVTKSLERLSSGLKINRASDDAAGLAISTKMQAQIDGVAQASRNASDGISIIQTADGALNEVHSMLQRMRELAVQSANDTNSNEDRDAIQSEIDSLAQELDRISTDTEFNKKTLFNGSLNARAYTDNDYVKMFYFTENVGEGTYGISILADATKTKATGGAGSGQSEPVTKEQAGTVSVNDISFNVEEGDTAAEVYAKFQDACERADITLSHDGAENFEAYSFSNALIFEAEEYGSSEQISVSAGNEKLAELLGISSLTVEEGKDVEAEFQKQDDGKYVGYDAPAAMVTKGTRISITDLHGFSMDLETNPNPDNPISGKQDVNIEVKDIGTLTLQIGANEGQTMEVRIPNMSSYSLGVDDLNLKGRVGASKAITKIDEAIKKVSSVRASLGAYENRLEHTVANLDLEAENLTAALSRIMDVDMAEEMTEYTKNNVLVQAGTSVLAQANDRPQTVLQLLQ